MKLKVKVKQNHWESGKRLSPYRCAVANALTSILGEITVCSRVYYTGITNHQDLREYPCSEIPEHAIHQMIRFDAGYSFPGEFSFELEIPEIVIDHINIGDLWKENHLEIVKI